MQAVNKWPFYATKRGVYLNIETCDYKGRRTYELDVAFTAYKTCPLDLSSWNDFPWNFCLTLV